MEKSCKHKPITEECRKCGTKLCKDCIRWEDDGIIGILDLFCKKC